MLKKQRIQELKFPEVLVEVGSGVTPLEMIILYLPNIKTLKLKQVF